MAEKAYSAELVRIVETAQMLAVAEDAPAVRIDHFLLGLILRHEAYRAEGMLKVLNQVHIEWESEDEPEERER